MHRDEPELRLPLGALDVNVRRFPQVAAEEADAKPRDTIDGGHARTTSPMRSFETA
jgi:hypothetical protein